MLLIASIATVSQLGGLSITIVVAMASLVCPVVWMAIVKRLPTYVKEFKGDYFNNKLPQVKNQILLFAGAGFLAQSISDEGVNIATTRMYRERKGDIAYTVLETDQEVDGAAKAAIEDRKSVV